MAIARKVMWVGITLLLLAGTGRARAGFIQSSTRLAGTQTITFDEHIFPSGTSITTEYADRGVLFEPNLYYSPLSIGGLPHIDNTNLSNFAGLGPPAVNPFTIVFTEPQTAADFAMVTEDGISTFTALLQGVPVESASVFTNLSSTTNYYGFGGITFDAIEVNAGGPSGVMVLDNIQFGQAAAVPEPSTWVLCGIGALGLLGYGHLRKRVGLLVRP